MLLLLIVMAALAGQTRDPKQVRTFRRAHPCPSTGVSVAACPGWVVDHIIPLSVYGSDTTDNMQWQTVEDAKRKDLLEYRAYRARMKAEKELCRPGKEL